MKTTLAAAAYAGYLMFGLFQILAAAGGIEHLTGLWWLICWFAALLVGWMPLVGTTLGIYGAHAMWEWSLSGALAVFVGIPALMLLLLTVSLRAASPAKTDDGATLNPQSATSTAADPQRRCAPTDARQDRPDQITGASI